MSVTLRSEVNVSLIPVLVTGIQWRRVCGAGDSFHAKDFAWLDPCDVPWAKP
jgi:ribose transport system ATP-binding protein